jgi:sterol desaturase/sphingolipid hydroxylase (fatty acid hydroxylase superfamily)
MGFSGATAILSVGGVGLISWLRHATLSARLLGSVWTGWRAAVWQPWFGVFIAALWVLQWRFPARRQERQFSHGLVQDVAWFLLSPVLAVTVISAYLVVFSSGVTAVFGHWHLDLVPSLGVWRVAALSFVVTDFMAWWTHWLHHRLPVLWQFHAVHHSQREMNVLSDNRTHVIETVVTATLAFIPAWFLGLNTSTAGVLAVSTVYVSAFIHTNIRTNLGPLRYVFVSPQAHRVHHSIEPAHYDTNFGTVFSWWDYLFGTRYPGDDEYPPTGIVDVGFPMEATMNPIRVARTWVSQTLYPFRILAARS